MNSRHTKQFGELLCGFLLQCMKEDVAVIVCKTTAKVSLKESSFYSVSIKSKVIKKQPFKSHLSFWISMFLFRKLTFCHGGRTVTNAVPWCSGLAGSTEQSPSSEFLSSSVSQEISRTLRKFKVYLLYCMTVGQNKFLRISGFTREKVTMMEGCTNILFDLIKNR